MHPQNAESLLTARILLDAGNDYITSHECFDRLGLLIHRKLGVLVCKACETCVLAPEGPSHCVNNHGRLPTDFDKVAYCQALVDNGLHLNYKDVIHPHPRGSPVQYLALANGLACRVSPEKCAYATPSKRMMENHIRDHGLSEGHLERYYIANANVQSLFRSSKARLWFQVYPNIVGDTPSSRDPLNKILQEVLPKFDPLPPRSAPNNDRERTRFIAFMNWDNIMGPYCEDPHKRAHLRALCAKPASVDPLSTIHGLFMEYVKLGRDVVLGNANQGFTVRKAVLHGDNISALPHPGVDKYWTPLPDNSSPAAYCDMYANLVTVLWRCQSVSEGEYHIELDPEQNLALQRLVEALSTTEVGKLRLLHSVITSLLPTAPAPAGGGTEAMARYIALRALRDDDNFVGPEVLSGWLAKLKYLCHNATAVEAFYTQANFPARGIIG